jgi:hypothetical protein
LLYLIESNSIVDGSRIAGFIGHNENLAGFSDCAFGGDKRFGDGSLVGAFHD